MIVHKVYLISVIILQLKSQFPNIFFIKINFNSTSGFAIHLKTFEIVFSPSYFI